MLLKFTLQESWDIDPLIRPVNELQFLPPVRPFLNQPTETFSFLVTEGRARRCNVAEKYWRLNLKWCLVRYWLVFMASEENKARVFTKYGIWQLLWEDRFMESLVQKAYSGFPFGMAALHYLLPFNMSFMPVCLKLKHDRDSLSSRPSV